VVSVFFFTVSALLFIAPTFPSFAGLPWGEGGVVATILGWIAGLSALMIVLYPGFFLSKNISIPFWNTPLLTVILVSYAVLGATAVILTASAFVALDQAAWVETTAIGLIVFNAILIPVYLWAMARTGGAAKESVRLLNRNKVAWVAWLGVVGVGMVLPLAALLWDRSMIPMAGAGLLVGGYLFRYCLLRVGVYVPAALVAEANLDLSQLNRTNAGLEQEYADMAAHGAGGGERGGR
jgi:formate-dependent nitrite reductase membrane component NrfD